MKWRLQNRVGKYDKEDFKNSVANNIYVYCNRS
jgi:hypothetical protein